MCLVLSWISWQDTVVWGCLLRVVGCGQWATWCHARMRARAHAGQWTKPRAVPNRKAWQGGRLYSRLASLADSLLLTIGAGRVPGSERPRHGRYSLFLAGESAPPVRRSQAKPIRTRSHTLPSSLCPLHSDQIRYRPTSGYDLARTDHPQASNARQRATDTLIRRYAGPPGSEAFSGSRQAKHSSSASSAAGADQTLTSI